MFGGLENVLTLITSLISVTSVSWVGPGGNTPPASSLLFFDFGLSIQLVVTCTSLMTSITKRPKDEQRTEGMVDLNLTL